MSVQQWSRLMLNGHAATKAEPAKPAGKPVPLGPEEYYSISGGRAERIQGTFDDGVIEPTAVDVVTMPDGKRLVFYPKDSIKPWPIAATIVQPPDAYTRRDMKNLLGRYVVTLARKALTPVDEDEGWTTAEIVIMVTLAVTFLVAGIAALFAYQGHKILSGF